MWLSSLDVVMQCLSGMGDSLGIYLSIESSSLGGFFYSLLGRYDIFYYFLPYLNLIKPDLHIFVWNISFTNSQKKKPIKISILILPGKWHFSFQLPTN